MRKLIYELVRNKSANNKLGKIYGFFISGTAILSVIPLMFKETNFILEAIDMVTVYILFTDYVLRWMTHDFKTGKMGKYSKFAFLIYPFTPMAIINFVSLLPSLHLVPAGLRILRMLRIFTVAHYSKSLMFIGNVFKKERKTLGTVLFIAIAYIYVSALAMFSYEPETFDSFFDALYWATTALTTVGYGDIFPKTDIGQLISMVSSLFGIAIIALPAGIVTAGFVDEINRDKEAKEREKQRTRELKEKNGELHNEQ